MASSLAKMSALIPKLIPVYKYSLGIVRRYSSIYELLFAPMQTEPPGRSRKVSIIGSTGTVGVACAYNFVINRICDTLVLMDAKERNKQLCGEALDMLHGSGVLSMPKVKICIGGDNTHNSDLLLICCGYSPTKIKDMKTLAEKNIELFRDVLPPLIKLSPNAVLLIITEPVSIMSYAAWKFTGLPKNRIIGIGTELDSSRFRFLIARKLGVSPKSVNAWIIGEKGKFGIPCWSTVNVAGTRLSEINCTVGSKACDEECWHLLHEQVKEADMLIRKLKSYQCWALSIIISSIVRAVLFNRRTIHAVATHCKSLQGIDTDAFISLPAVLGNRGVHKVIKQKLSCQEIKDLLKTAKFIDDMVHKIKWPDVPKEEHKMKSVN